MQRVLIVGGTHGNEWGGIYLCRKWEKEILPFRQYPFQVETCLANPHAIERNQRYVEEDLNRCFRPADLANLALDSYEAQRAKVLHQSFQKTDFLIDLHNTTSNMGFTVILSREDALEDRLTRQLCAHLVQQDALVRIYFMPQAAEESPYLPSVAARDLTLEVGPMMHGTLRADLYFKTEQIVAAALDYLAAWQVGEAEEYEGELTVYRQLENLDFPRQKDGSLAGMIYPGLLGRDFQPLYPQKPLFSAFNGQTIVYQGHETVWPVFINEQAYYEKGLALSLTRRERILL
ncbi:aspartoacylase [bacterium (Candidatus Blackallbacteria) CG17_big_fil_post_rev_8_21_14_2_50_48_46]|uniref:Aspartoacylase n=1 Tax=bacterium (Candidatus Blackallbacteria) CG17_big_fil_post_rev_8_21_14_2_50_48_46 TaxID=2014261 RepID=A0A2M7FYX9_9BACT|nr:MAG: aspartoacylase [bacterium (Candidatus Blackallbacteria) CG18_big_fil_WC_8_21_14_2_50_49_26]PIW14580.1 MAG: aspartoacylase [bacterium (Candidatus Blackallbacteria) CG17_big_fil_post_rev_8_21_14_2_50_48_46]PIW47265.1 MAG: aspartoacylase [bacterium (Candidatus Blackallbacteria) CG13_big_fil_rev_8_21_14_2_50_49_14]